MTTQHISAGDVDGDANADILGIGSQSMGWLVYGPFDGQVEVAAGATITRPNAFEERAVIEIVPDLNGDGVDDVALADREQRTVELIYGAGL